MKDEKKTKAQLVEELEKLRERNRELEHREGNPIGMMGTVGDITELKQTEKNYRNLVDNALVGIFKRNAEGDIFYMNQALVSMLEYDSVEELRSVKFVDVYENAKDRDRFVEALKEKGKVVGHELRLLTKTGRTKSVLVNGVLENGIVSGMMMDITERKAMEEELRRNEERHRTLFDDSPISLWEEDYSEVKRHIEQLRDEGVEDFRGYLEKNPETVEHCAAMVKVVDVNEATLDMYEAKSKEDFLEGLGQIFTEQSYEVFREGLIAIAEGNKEGYPDTMDHPQGCREDTRQSPGLDR